MRPFAASILRKRLLLASMIATAGLGSSGTLRAQLLLDPPPEALPTPSSVIGGSSQTEATLSSGEQSLEVPPEEVDGVTPLLRGPLHEAYAERFDMDQEEPIIVGKEPPAWVDEQPPEYRPEGDDYVWIPGYWGWDIIEEDFIWVSGIWRQVPPDTQWVPGYWTEVEGGWQWVSGFWTTTEQEEIVYLPPPPENIDHGPSSQHLEMITFGSLGTGNTAVATMLGSLDIGALDKTIGYGFPPATFGLRVDISVDEVIGTIDCRIAVCFLRRFV